MTTLLERATTAARTGQPRDLLTLRTSTDLTALAANAATGLNGGKVLSGVPICKVGSFNGGDAMGGIDLDAADLAAVAQRFTMLSPRNLVPPVRLDHGYSVRDIIGSIAALSVVELPDESDGDRVKPFLTADLHIVDDQALKLMKLGLLRNRSAELSPYRTNAGEVHPLVCWGLAFVDIPAVEGLGGIKLGATRTAAERIVVLTETTRDGSTMTTPTQAPAADAAAAPAAPQTPGPDTTPVQQTTGDGDQAAPATPRTEPVPDGTPVHDEAEVEAASGLPDDAPLDAPAAPSQTAPPAGGAGASTPAQPAPAAPAEPAPDAAPTSAQLTAARELLVRAGQLPATAPLTPAQALRSAGFTAQADELDAAHTAAVQLRVDGLARSGAIPPRATTALAAARTLLGHSDPTISTAAGRLLEAVVPPVKLGERLGQQSSEHGPGGDGERTPVALAALPPQDFPSAWAQLSSEQRAKPEYDRVYQDWRKTQS